MITKRLLRALPAILLFNAPSVFAQINSYDSPAAAGQPVKSIVQIGPMNTSNYDVAITLLETVRGRQAMHILKTADMTNKPPRAGFEYVLARIRFHLQGRAVTDIGAFVLGDSPFQWVAYSANLDQYDNVSVSPPGPVLQGPVKSGETKEGWVAFAVAIDEAKPIMTFDPSSGGATGRGNILFFKLY